MVLFNYSENARLTVKVYQVWLLHYYTLTATSIEVTFRSDKHLASYGQNVPRKSRRSDFIQNLNRC
jgi:hypothetical protein